MDCKFGTILTVLTVGSWFFFLVSSIPRADAQFDRIRGYFNNIDSRLDSFSRRFDLNVSVRSMFQDMNDFRHKISDIGQCYQSKLENEEVDIFGDNMTIQEVIKKYYNAFPEKRITTESIRTLMSSIGDIVESCIEANTNGSSNGTTTRAQYGFTELSDNNDDQIRQMLGALSGLEEGPDSDNNDNDSNNNHRYHHHHHQRNKRLTAADSECLPSSGGGNLPERFDWRERNVVTKPKRQGSCGSCWAFATVGSIESATLINNNKSISSGNSLDLAEQEVVDCAKSNGCQGGYALQSFRFAKDNGLTSESEDPYRARASYCRRRDFPTVASIRDFCVRSKFRYSRNFNTEQLTDQDIMEALVEFGPLYSTIDANPRMVRNYRGGVMRGPCSTRINHAVLLVGYTPYSWIIKNSWGTSWGQDGFFELEKNGNDKCGIHTEIAYPLLS